MSNTSMCLLFLLFLLVSITGCRGSAKLGSIHGKVDSSLLVPMGASRYAMKENEVFQVADKLPRQKIPEYPAAWLPNRLPPQTVCIDVVVEPGGTISEASINARDTACNPPGTPRIPDFADSALEAVRDWQFWGSRICRFPAGMEHNDACEGDGVEIVPVPVRLTYIFEFSQQDGKPDVHEARH